MVACNFESPPVFRVSRIVRSDIYVNMRLHSKNCFCIVILLCIIAASAPAQNWTFGRHSGSGTNDYGSHIAIDAIGNIYTVGEYTGTATFDSIVVPSQGKWNAILAKYDASGNIQWAKTVAFTTDPNSDLYANAIGIDKDGNVYIGGKFYVDISISEVSFSCNGSSDMYLAKFSGDGSLIWARQAGGIGQGSYGQDEIHALALDAAGNCYITGTYNQDAKFDSIELSSPNTMEVFIAKYDKSGNGLWAISGGENGINHTGTAIQVDTEGNCYVTGIFYEKLALGKDTLDAVDAEQKIFLAKIADGGAFLWAVKIGSGGYYGGARDLKIDRDGNFYLAGFFRAGMHIGSEDISYSNGLKYAALILKYDKEGNFLWVKKTDGDSQNATLSGLALDSKNAIFVTGSSNATVSFGSTSISSATAVSFGFVAELNSEGTFQWVKSLDGYGNISGSSVAATSSDDWITSGTFDSTVIIGAKTFASGGGSDVFLAKLTGQINAVSEHNAPSSLFLYPNPANSFINLQGIVHSSTVTILSSAGNMIRSVPFGEQIDIRAISPGSYFLNIDGTSYKFIKER